jgi:hypothetical protein
VGWGRRSRELVEYVECGGPSIGANVPAKLIDTPVGAFPVGVLLGFPGARPPMVSHTCGEDRRGFSGLDAEGRRAARL